MDNGHLIHRTTTGVYPDKIEPLGTCTQTVLSHLPKLYVTCRMFYFFTGRADIPFLRQGTTGNWRVSFLLHTAGLPGGLVVTLESCC